MCAEKGGTGRNVKYSMRYVIKYGQTGGREEVPKIRTSKQPLRFFFLVAFHPLLFSLFSFFLIYLLLCFSSLRIPHAVYAGIYAMHPSLQVFSSISVSLFRICVYLTWRRHSTNEFNINARRTLLSHM